MRFSHILEPIHRHPWSRHGSGPGGNTCTEQRSHRAYASSLKFASPHHKISIPRILLRQQERMGCLRRTLPADSEQQCSLRPRSCNGRRYRYPSNNALILTAQCTGACMLCWVCAIVAYTIRMVTAALMELTVVRKKERRGVRVHASAADADVAGVPTHVAQSWRRFGFYPLVPPPRVQHQRRHRSQCKCLFRSSAQGAVACGDETHSTRWPGSHRLARYALATSAQAFPPLLCSSSS